MLIKFFMLLCCVNETVLLEEYSLEDAMGSLSIPCDVVFLYLMKFKVLVHHELNSQLMNE